MLSDTKRGIVLVVSMHVLLAFTSFAFGSSYVFTTMSLSGSDFKTHPVIFLSFRVLIGFITLLPFALIFDFPRQKSTSDEEKRVGLRRFVFVPSVSQLFFLVIAGLLLVPLNMLAFIYGLYFTDSFVAGILQLNCPIMTAAIAILLKSEKMSVLKVLGILIAVCGAASVIGLNAFMSTGRQAPSSEDTIQRALQEEVWMIWGVNARILLGLGVLWFNTTCYAAYLNYSKKIMEKHKIPVVTASMYTFGFGFLFLIPLCVYLYAEVVNLFVNGTWLVWFALFYSGFVAGTLTNVISLFGAKIVGASVTTIYTCLIPLFSGIFSYALLGTYIHPGVIVLGLVIAMGVLLVAWARYRETKSSTPIILPIESDMTGLVQAQPIEENGEELQEPIFEENQYDKSSSDIPLSAQDEAVSDEEKPIS